MCFSGSKAIVDASGCSAKFTVAAWALWRNALPGSAADSADVGDWGTPKASVLSHQLHSLPAHPKNISIELMSPCIPLYLLDMTCLSSPKNPLLPSGLNFFSGQAPDTLETPVEKADSIAARRSDLTACAKIQADAARSPAPYRDSLAFLLAAVFAVAVAAACAVMAAASGRADATACCARAAE